MRQTDSEIESALGQSASHKTDVTHGSSQRNGGGEQQVRPINNGTDNNNNDGMNTSNSERYKSEIIGLRRTGELLRSDKDQPDLSIKPSWFDETLFENAKRVYARHFMGVNFAHLSGLLLLVRVNSIYHTLSSTGRSDSVAKLFRRYYQTVVHVKKWYEHDIFEEDSDAHRSLSIVRGMHNRVSTMLNDGRQDVLSPATNIANGHTNGNTNGNATNGHAPDVKQKLQVDMNSELVTPDINNSDKAEVKSGVHISEYDIMLTQFAFVGFIVTRAKHVGLIEEFSQHDLESMLHFWRVIGYYLGASDEYNLCSRKLDDVRGLCDAIIEVEFRKSIIANPIPSQPGIMGINIVRSVKFIPMLTIYGITKYLYELLNLETSEFEARATRYSRLSYTLIKLVMTRLLAYKPLRWFNNGLTRLSVFLVGKIEDHFEKYLESKYGQELKA